MTDLRTQGQDECVAYGTLAALESMLKIHYYNDPGREFNLFDAKIDETQQNLLAAMGTNRSVENACTILTNSGIVIPDRSAAYKIAEWRDINSEGTDSVETIIAKAKVYLETNGPIIARYSDEAIGDHCVAIVGYTDDGKWICKDSWPLDGDGNPHPNVGTTWNSEGECIIAGATGGYREIGADYMIRNRSGNLYAILIQKLNISISSVHITKCYMVKLLIKKNDTTLANLDPSFISMFQDRFDASKGNLDNQGRPPWNCVQLKPKNGGTTFETLDNLEVVVGPGSYHIHGHLFFNNPGSNEWGEAQVDVQDVNCVVNVSISVQSCHQCAQEILYPFALDAMKRGPSEDERADIKVALRLLLRMAEISKEEFIADLEQRLVDLREAHGRGVDGALETRQATEEILELVRSIGD